MKQQITINLNNIYHQISGDKARLSDVVKYVSEAKKIAGDGNVIILTGAAPYGCI